MEAILVLGAEGSGYEKVAYYLADLEEVSSVTPLNTFLDISSQEVLNEEFKALWERTRLINEDRKAVLYGPVLSILPRQKQFLLPKRLVPFLPAEVIAIINVEAPLSSYQQVLTNYTEEQVKKIVFNERTATVDLAETRKIPLFTVRNSELPKEEVFREMAAFLHSLSEDEIPIQEVGLAQEIQCSVYECSEETQQEMLDWLVVEGVNRDRIQVQWDTWIGVYLTPPTDEPRWNQQEFQQIKSLIEKHPNVMKVDIPEQNREGMARSTG